MRRERSFQSEHAWTRVSLEFSRTYRRWMSSENIEKWRRVVENEDKKLGWYLHFKCNSWLLRGFKESSDRIEFKVENFTPASRWRM